MCGDRDPQRRPLRSRRSAGLRAGPPRPALPVPLVGRGHAHSAAATILRLVKPGASPHTIARGSTFKLLNKAHTETHSLCAALGFLKAPEASSWLVLMDGAIPSQLITLSDSEKIGWHCTDSVIERQCQRH
jgi:hypothetical protein